MSDRRSAVVLAVLTVVFIVLNFTVQDAGTIFLILALVSGIGAGYFYRKT